MQNKTLKILMVEDNAAQAYLMQEALKGSGLRVAVDHVKTLEAALEHAQTGVDLILLDLGLPDSSGIQTVRRMHAAAPEVPIVVLTSLSDEETGVEAVREGAQDYLDKAQLSGRMLGRIMRYALERSSAEEKIRQNNQMLKAFIKASPLAIITLDREGHVTTWNTAAEEIFGWKEKEVLGRPVPIVPEEGRSEFQRFLDRDFQGRSRRSVEVKRKRKDETVVDISLSTAPIRDAAGQVVAVVGILEDITQRKRSEEERVRLQEQLHQTQKLEAVGQLAAEVAHDFNNLMMVILGNVDRMNRLLGEKDEGRDLLGMIEEAAKQATGVTRSLLTFSHKIPCLKLHTSLNGVVEESARLLQRLLSASIELHLELPAGEPIWVVADRSQLQQVVLNLAINARDAMPQGGRITLALSRVPVGPATADQLFARLEVSDTGTGIDPEHIPHIFEPFFTTKPRERGTGLGLAIVRSIVEDHGGRIELESHSGQGSRFVVTLPASATGPAEEDESDLANDVPHGRNELLLLAEDNAHVREVVASALRSFGYNVVVVADGAAALQEHANRKGQFAALVFDHQLPKQTGLECIRQIRCRGDRTPAIITTGSAGVDFENELGENTVLLRKPFQMSELARVLFKRLQASESSP